MMLAVEDMLDGKTYPLWSYMMRHVLVAKGLWNIVAGIDVRPASGAKNAGIVVDEAGTSTTSTTQVQVIEPPTQNQRRWDGRDAHSHALIALSVKHSIIPHIHSCKIAKEAWDVLANLYQACNEACATYYHKQLLELEP